MPLGLSAWPNSRRIKPSTNSDAFNPQAGQTNLTGLAAMAGVISNWYFAPQEHWIFIRLGISLRD
jgi:hypothetical protein